MRIIAIFFIAFGLWAQVQPPPAPWRGAGPTPCVGSDGGIYKCPPAPATVAVRAGRLFDSKTGQLLTKQVVLISGDRITEVGAEGQVKIPAGERVIDLSGDDCSAWIDRRSYPHVQHARTKDHDRKRHADRGRRMRRRICGQASRRRAI